MKRSTKVRLGMAGMALGIVAVAALPANAAQSTGAGTIVGTGTISPGLTQTGDPSNTFTFGGSGAVVTDTAQGLINCTVSGNDTIGSWAQGAGNFNGTCSGAVSASVSGSYTRTGAVVTLSGTAVGTGISGVFGAACVFGPTNVSVTTGPPTVVKITSYGVVCVIHIP